MNRPLPSASPGSHTLVPGNPVLLRQGWDRLLRKRMLPFIRYGYPKPQEQ
ncbi:MAG: hypothetical protein LBQ30_03745 [Treponema sp.]|nr:hypothetical protein [Treponema sp.]